MRGWGPKIASLISAAVIFRLFFLFARKRASFVISSALFCNSFNKISTASLATMFAPSAFINLRKGPQLIGLFFFAISKT